jgi:predicted SnoaL-like aldol condensation-catalyzing enzyme
MKLTTFISTTVLAITSISSAAAAATQNCPARQVSPAEQLTIFKDFVKLFYITKDIPTAFQSHVAESYIQHNPNFQSGRQVAQDGLAKYIPPLNVTVAKIALSDSTGWVFAKQVTKAQEGTGLYTVVVDVFRMEGSCVVEHWDVVQSKPAGASNPLAMFDRQEFGNAV